MGVLLPYYFLAAYLFLNDQLKTIVNYSPLLHMHFPVTHPDLWMWINLGYLLAALLVGMVYWQRYNNRMVMQIRKNWSIMLVLLLILVIAPFLFDGAGMDTAILCLIPLSAFVANAYSYPKRLFLPNLIFWVAMILVVHNNWELIKK
jgi:predicted transporter